MQWHCSESYFNNLAIAWKCFRPGLAVVIYVWVRGLVCFKTVKISRCVDKSSHYHCLWNTHKAKEIEWFGFSSKIRIFILKCRVKQLFQSTWWERLPMAYILLSFSNTNPLTVSVLAKMFLFCFVCFFFLFCLFAFCFVLFSYSAFLCRFHLHYTYSL